LLEVPDFKYDYNYDKNIVKNDTMTFCLKTRLEGKYCDQILGKDMK
jgi:hypothetical protein